MTTGKTVIVYCFNSGQERNTDDFSKAIRLGEVTAFSEIPDLLQKHGLPHGYFAYKHPESEKVLSYNEAKERLGEK